jgi:hypothetical protein
MFDMVAVEEVEKAEDTVTGAKVCVLTFAKPTDSGRK